MENKVDVLSRFAEEYPNLSKSFYDIVGEQYGIFAGKHLDYGMWNIAAGTRLETEEDKKFALEGLWFRISDKMNRWKNLMKSEQINNESLEDTFRDLINYSIISLMVYQDNWKK